MNNTCLRNIKAWYFQKKESCSTRLLGLDEYEHEEDNKDEKLREDLDAVAKTKPSEARVTTDHV